MSAGIGLQALLTEGEHLFGELVRSSWPRALGHERRQPALIERRLRGIERLAREPERISRARDLLALDAHAADHLVLDLHQIARVKELRRGERLIGDRLRSRVEAARLAQRPDLRIVFLACGHLASEPGNYCQANYADLQGACQAGLLGKLLHGLTLKAIRGPARLAARQDLGIITA